MIPKSQKLGGHGYCPRCNGSIAFCGCFPGLFFRDEEKSVAREEPEELDAYEKFKRASWRNRALLWWEERKLALSGWWIRLRTPDTGEGG